MGSRFRSLSIIFVFCLAPAVIAQTTTVTGTVTDSAGTPYASATLKAQLMLAGGGATGQATVTNTNQAQCSSGSFGSAPCQIPFPGTAGPITLDPTGSFTLNLQDNSLVTPAATKWLFTVNSLGVPPPFGTGPQTCTATLTITGSSQSISSTFSACPRLTSAANTGIIIVDTTKYGAKGDGVTDDTAAIQAAINAAVGSTGAAATQSADVFIPQPSVAYLISSPIYYIGSPGVGIHLSGAIGATRSPSGTRFRWSATASTNLPMFVLMGANASVVEHLEFDANNRARVGIHLAATNVVNTTLGTAVSAGVATVTPGAMTNIAVGTLLNIDSGTSLEFVYATATTATTFTATFAKSHTSTAVVGNSAGSSGVVLRNVTVANIPNGTGDFVSAPVTAAGGIVIGNATTVGGGSPQVSELRFYDTFIQGFVSPSTTATGIATLTGGNAAKNVWINGFGISGMTFAVDLTNSSGAVDIRNGSIVQTSTADFRIPTNQQVTLSAIEVESGLATGHQFVTSPGSGANIGLLTITNCSFQAAAPASDYVISYGGNLTLIGNGFQNSRTGTSIAKIQQFQGPLFSNTQAASINSFGNWFQNAVAGYAPFFDGSNNVLLPTYFANQPVAVVSSGDMGGVSGALIKLNNYITTSVLTNQASTPVAASGVLRGGNTDTLIAWRNNAATGDVGVSKNTSDQILAGPFILPNVADQAVGRATTDTLTNKTLTSPVLTTPTIGGGTTLTKYSRFSVSLTPAAVAANTCAAQSFTVTGIAAADILIAASKPTEQAGLSSGLGHVTGANTATINFCNNTAAAITPTAAETYQFVTVQ